MAGNIFRVAATILACLLLISLTHSATIAQELLPGRLGFIISPDGAVGETVVENRVVNVPYGQALRIEEIAPNRIIVRHHGSQVLVNPFDIANAQTALASLKTRINAGNIARLSSQQADLLYSLNRIAEAIPVTNRALQLNPRNKRALHIQALIAGRNNDLATLTKIVNGLKSLSPNDATDYQIQFELESRKKRWPEALRLSKEGIDLFPANSQLWSSRAAAHFQLGELEQADQCLREAIAKSPCNPNTYRDHGLLALRQDRRRGGVELLKNAARLHDNRYETYRMLLEQRDEQDDEVTVRRYLIQAAACGDCTAQQKRRIAWLLATGQGAQQRSGHAALEIADALVRAGQIEPEMQALCLKTQAAALAELGRFPAAMDRLELINPDSRDAQYMRMLDSIGQERPFRDITAFADFYPRDQP